MVTESEGQAGEVAAVRPFDAPAHMRKIRTRQGMQDYLDVKWRIAWLRSEFPDAQIVTEQIEGDEDHARFRCTITLPTGGVSTGHGSETLHDFPDFYEKAETKAIGRACAVLGYGTDAATDLDDGEPMDGLPAAKSERSDRRMSDAERATVDRTAETIARETKTDGNAPITPSQVKALDRLKQGGFDVEEYALTNWKIGEVNALTMAQAGQIITAAQNRRR